MSCPVSTAPLKEQLVPFILLGNYDALELWPALNIVLFGWLLLFFAPRWKWTSTLTLIPPIFLSIVYVGSLWSVILFPPADGGDLSPIDFATFEGIVTLFQNPNVVFPGWVHYLVFDLLVGRMIVEDSIKRNVSMILHILIIIPACFGTFMFGPTGYLFYMTVRTFFLPLPSNEEGGTAATRNNETNNKKGNDGKYQQYRD